MCERLNKLSVLINVGLYKNVQERIRRRQNEKSRLISKIDVVRLSKE